MAIEKDVLKEMVGKRITIDGNRHRVEKVVVKTGLIITRDGTEAHADGVYKKGPGFFYDSPKKGKKSTAKVKEEPVKETARARRARERAEAEAADAPKETARARRAREKAEALEAEQQPASRRARNKNKTKDEEPSKPAGRKTRIKRDGDDAVPSKKKKMFEQFDQAIAERISQEAFDLLGQVYADKGTYGITAVAVGGKFDDDALRVMITFMPSVKDTKEIKSYIRDHREATDISSEDEEDDDLEDEELDDSDSEDEDLEENDEEEIEDDEEEDEEEDEDDEEEDDEDEDEEDEETVTVEEMVDAIRGFAPDLKSKVLTNYVEGFYASDECTEKFDGELIPGFTRLQEKGGKGPECLLIGFDEKDEVVKLLNLSTLKTRSKSITEVVHMEVLELEDDE